MKGIVREWLLGFQPGENILKPWQWQWLQSKRCGLSLFLSGWTKSRSRKQVHQEKLTLWYNRIVYKPLNSVNFTHSKVTAAPDKKFY